MDTTMEFSDLANAIILQAIKDYEKAYTEILCLNNTDEDEHRKRYLKFRMHEVDLFFHSDWCESLTRKDVLRSWTNKKKEIQERYGEID